MTLLNSPFFVEDFVEKTQTLLFWVVGHFCIKNPGPLTFAGPLGCSLISLMASPPLHLTIHFMFGWGGFWGSADRMALFPVELNSTGC